jgi:putative Mg2+ transporter-C (MgtC) family protein
MDAWWMDVWMTVRQEFSDLDDVRDFTRTAVRLLVAAALGAVIGHNRESRGKPAGLRTHMLVSIGAAVFVVAPLQLGMRVEDLSRVLQGVTAGIGFLGAGAVIKLQQRQEIHGLTTAASIWTAAAVGIAAGLGQEMTAILSTLFIWCVLAAVYRLEKSAGRSRRRRRRERGGGRAAGRR